MNLFRARRGSPFTRRRAARLVFETLGLPAWNLHRRRSWHPDKQTPLFFCSSHGPPRLCQRADLGMIAAPNFVSHAVFPLKFAAHRKPTPPLADGVLRWPARGLPLVPPSGTAAASKPGLGRAGSFAGPISLLIAAGSERVGRAGWTSRSARVLFLSGFGGSFCRLRAASISHSNGAGKVLGGYIMGTDRAQGFRLAGPAIGEPLCQCFGSPRAMRSPERGASRGFRGECRCSVTGAAGS